MKKFLAITSIMLIVVFSADIASVTSSAKESKFIRSTDAAPGRYIVVLDEKAFGSLEFANRTESASFELAGTYGGSVDKVFSSALYGYSTQMTEENAIALSGDVRVSYVEEDAMVYESALQLNSTWGLDRTDQRAYPLNGSYQYTSSGSGVNAYIIDSGIRTTHQDFGGRAFNSVDFVNDGQNGNDCNGHGTHVAGTVGGSTFGVAKNVRLYSVRVLACDGSGLISNIIAAVNWVTANRTNPSVANISITASGPSASLNTAITNSIASGVTYTIAAGNFSSDACAFSPASTPNAITVGSTVVNNGADYRMGYSNQGPCVDIFAPGNGIESLSNADDVSSKIMNGTSMAAPHVAGVAALYLETHPNASPATVAQEILDGATTGTVTNIATNTVNKQLYSWIGGSTPPAPPAVVTIVKQITNAQGGTASSTSFGYTASNLGTSGFALVDNDSPPADRYVNSNIASLESTADIVVTESTLAGWALNSIQCVETPGSGMTNIQNSTVDVTNRKATIKVEAGEQVTCTFFSQELAPSSAPASASGRVVDSKGKGIRGVSMSITNAATGETTYAMTNSFGYFTFSNLRTTNLYQITASAKRYRFSPAAQSFVLDGDLAGITFVGSGG